ncbi:MAG: hypothetical protein PHG83_00215 [Patescibacteria group bacterium]|nr:hypothetical protein [Patescibacteria group bacterium]
MNIIEGQYPSQEAEEEASRMKQKIKSGEAKSYQEADELIKSENLAKIESETKKLIQSKTSYPIVEKTIDKISSVKQKVDSGEVPLYTGAEKLINIENIKTETQKEASKNTAEISNPDNSGAGELIKDEGQKTEIPKTEIPGEKNLYSKEEALDKASRMKQKVDSGKAADYNSAQTMVAVEDYWAKNPEETSKKTAAILSPDNRKKFNEMSEKGKDIANQFFKGLYRISGIDKIVDKLKITHKQSQSDRYEKKAVEFKIQADALKLEIEELNQSKKPFDAAIENLKKQNLPGSELLELKLKDLDRQTNYLLNEKDKIQTKFEANESKMKLYTKERNKIVGKFIERYDEKLEPMEKELENLQKCEKRIDLDAAIMEEKQAKQTAEFDNKEKQKKQIEDTLRATGMSEKEIQVFPAIEILNQGLSQGYEKIKIEKENLAQKKMEIEKKIAKIDAQANPYRDKRDEFARITEDIPLEMEMEKRKRVEEFKGKEKIIAHTRQENSEIINVADRKPVKEIKAEETEKNKEEFEVSSYITGWNAYLKEKYNENASTELINLENFLNTTGFPKDYKLDFSFFKNILLKYCTFQDIPTDKLNQNIDKFFEDKIKI